MEDQRNYIQRSEGDIAVIGPGCSVIVRVPHVDSLIISYRFGFKASQSLSPCSCLHATPLLFDVKCPGFKTVGIHSWSLERCVHDHLSRPIGICVRCITAPTVKYAHAIVKGKQPTTEWAEDEHLEAITRNPGNQKYFTTQISHGMRKIEHLYE